MQGFNRYYPPDYDPKNPSHKGNLNRLAGKAAQKPIVRFEMPFNVWCLHCDSHIAQGVRFNAEKKKMGNYFTSPIYSFTMKCHLCSGVIIITTNPKDTCYDVTEGAKKKSEEWNAKESGTFEFNYEDGNRAEEVDPIYKLEQDATQKLNVKNAHSHITQLRETNERQWSDPFSQSQKLRKSFRTEKKRLHVAKQSRDRIGHAYGLGIDVLDPSSSDTMGARKVEFEGKARSAVEAQRQIVMHGPLFKRGPSNSLHPHSIGKSNQAGSLLRIDPLSFSLSASKRVGEFQTSNGTARNVQKSSKHSNLVDYASEDETSE